MTCVCDCTRTRRTRVLRKRGWEGGSDPEYLDELIRYWRDEYDWRLHEHELNQLSQYIARIDDASIHYVHETGLGAHPTPVLLLHGWPDSFLRYRKAIPHLDRSSTMQREPTFDVVVPSLPGFAFTGVLPPPSEIRRSVVRGALLYRLMTEVLGYEEFIVAGGDGGSAHRAEHGHPVPDRDHGHASHRYRLVRQCQPGVADRHRAQVHGSREAALHGRRRLRHGACTQPRALAASLNDSPAGLASWIVDRFHSWADSPTTSREQLQQGRDPDQHHYLLGDADHPVIDLRLSRRDAPALARRRGLRRSARGTGVVSRRIWPDRRRAASPSAR